MTGSSVLFICLCMLSGSYKWLLLWMFDQRQLYCEVWWYRVEFTYGEIKELVYTTWTCTHMHHNVIDLSLSITVCLVIVWQLDQLSHKGLMWSVSCFMLSLFVFSVWCLWPILELTVVIVPLNTLQTCHFGGYNRFLDMTVPRHLFTIYTFLFGKCVITYFTGFCNFYKVVKECVLSLLTILQ